MRKLSILGAAAALVVGSVIVSADPTPILAPGNPILAFDSDKNIIVSSYPAAESPAKLIDGLSTGTTATKYLNFAREGSGVIVTPLAGSSIIQSFQLTTANDDDRRDPASFQLFGTNSPIVSADNSIGTAEPWSLISSGPLSLPAGATGRLTSGSPVDVANSTSYASYKLLFPTLRAPTGGGCCMQIGEAQFYTGTGAGGAAILSPTDNIRAIDDPAFALSQSNYPAGEEPNKAIDQIAAAPPGVSTKYLNFGREHAGLIVTPSVHAIVDGIQFTMSNDTPSRDPALVTIYGTNDAITDADNSLGTGENWTVIVANLAYASPDTRYIAGPLVSFPNGTAYNSYKIEVVDNKGPDTLANSIQFAEVQLFSGSVPEPSVMMLAIGGAVALVARRRR